MEKIFQILSPEFFTSLGVLVLFFIILFKEKIGDLIFKRKSKEREEDEELGFVERRKSSVIDSDRLFDIMEKNIDATTRFASETRELSETIRELTDGMNRRSDKALTQHIEIIDRQGDILGEIDRLDIPRKRPIR